MLGEEHGHALVISNPAGVTGAAVGQVRREQRVEVIIRKPSLQRFETDLLQHHVAIGIGEYFLEDAVAAAAVGVGQLIRGRARFKRLVLECAVPFLLGKESLAIGDDEAQIARAGLVHTRKIHFIQNAVTQREPDPAVLVQCRAYAGLGARGPARRNPGPAGGVVYRIAHEVFVRRCTTRLRSMAGQKASAKPNDKNVTNGARNGRIKTGCAESNVAFLGKPSII